MNQILLSIAIASFILAIGLITTSCICYFPYVGCADDCKLTRIKIPIGLSILGIVALVLSFIFKGGED